MVIVLDFILNNNMLWRNEAWPVNVNHKEEETFAKARNLSASSQHVLFCNLKFASDYFITMN